MIRSWVMATIGSPHALFCPGSPSIACPLGSSDLHPLLRLFPTLSLTQGGISSLDLVLPLALPPPSLPQITLIPTEQLSMSLLLFCIQEQFQGRVFHGGGFSGHGFQCECRLTWSFKHRLLNQTSACSSCKGDINILRTPVSKPACARQYPCLSH